MPFFFFLITESTIWPVKSVIRRLKKKIGDGYLGINEGKPVFVLTQKESKILYEIMDILKFGHVKEFDGFYRYIVREQSNVFLLFHLFNGNLHLIPRIEQLKEWSTQWNSKVNNKYNQLKPITNPFKLSLDNSWLSGFFFFFLVIS